jgi:hypothetical protein
MKSISSILVLSAFMVCNFASAQIDVREEPHHKLLLENEFIRIYDGHIPFGDTTLIHGHSANSVVVFLSKSTFGIQNVGEKPSRTEVKPGDIIYRSYDQNPVRHIVWNKTRLILHFMVVETVKQHPDDDGCAIISGADMMLEFSQKMVRAYHLEIAKSSEYVLPKSNCAYLLINISGVFTAIYEGSICKLQADDFVFFPPQREIRIKGSSDEHARSVLLELK